MNTALAAEEINLMKGHPCFDAEAHDRVGRIHLPIAPACNIQCNFCERKICANLAIQHPGWTGKILSPGAALELVRSLIQSGKENFVVGIAGPGDPLANEATFEALRLIHNEYPDIVKCISTNGLLLAEKLPQLLEVGIHALTVTINAIDSGVGKHIYTRVRYQEIVYRGEEAARLLITKQLLGIEKAIDAGLSLKVNTVLIPGLNDQHMMKLALGLRQTGVKLMNIMPLIPAGRMRHHRAPTCDELRNIRQDCETLVPQFYRCEHCRADVMYLI